MSTDALRLLIKRVVQKSNRRFSVSLGFWIGTITLVAIIVALRTEIPWLMAYPDDWVLPIASWINKCMDWVIFYFDWFFRAISWILTWPINGLLATLHRVPWWITVACFTIFAYFTTGWRIALFVTAAFLYMVGIGYWYESMSTLALVVLSVPLSVLLGLFSGIAAFKWEKIERVIQPMLDLMQTFPTFAYLIPILTLFGFGPVVGLIASIIYAVPPMTRNTLLGLKRVPSDIVESAMMSGTTPHQLLWWVQIPSAKSALTIGINQTTMAALSMVIIAAVIGGWNDIGWKVLISMRKANFGDGVTSGLVIALLAMILDRISSGLGRRTGDGSFAGVSDLWKLRNPAVLLGLLVVLSFFVGMAFYATNYWHAPNWSLSGSLNSAVSELNKNYYYVFDFIKNTVLSFVLLPARIGLENTVRPSLWGLSLTSHFIYAYILISGTFCLIAGVLGNRHLMFGVVSLCGLYYFGTTGVPWPIFILVCTSFAYQINGWRLALWTGGGLVFMLVTGLWTESMRSIALCGVAVFVSVVIGVPIGIWAALSSRVSAFIRPINDTLQTMPQFVYLVPVVIFFQVGDLPALIAVIAYAIVPMIRYTEHGIRNVDSNIIEVATAQGCTKVQILREVQFPLAMPEIALGINQTIVYALAMLVIAAMVGTQGLGQQIYIALNNADVGGGITAGLAMTFIAMIADRNINTWTARKRDTLGV